MEGTPVTVGVGNMISKIGYSLMLSTDTAGLVWETLLKFGAVPMGANCWEHLRIQRGHYRMIMFSCGNLMFCMLNFVPTIM